MPPRTILVADEDIDTRVILRTLLERNGFAVIEAATPDDAVSKSMHHAFDLVILNHPMTMTGGATLVQYLRQTGTRAPILNITSRVLPHYFDEAMRQGVTVSMAKPIDVGSVLRVVCELTAQPLAVAN